MAERKARPKTGEKRKTEQPLKIDRLPPSVHEAILHLYHTLGKSWQQIEDLSALPLDESKGKGGFVPWHDLPLSVLEDFPDMKLPHTTLHRWFDIRVRQVSRETLHRSKQTHEIVKVFAGSSIEGSEEATTNAARDVIFRILSEDSSEVGRNNAAKGLLKLAEIQQKVRTNDIRERKVSVEEKSLQAKLDEIRKRTERLMKDVEGGESGAIVPLTTDQLMEKVRGIYGLI